jgi:DNA-binding transcriptional MocR family regulator
MIIETLPAIEARAAREPISLIRTTPPTPPWLSDILRDTLREISNRNDLELLLRHHKFAGSLHDRKAAGIWLSQRFGSVPEAERIIVTNGTQNALLIALVAIVGPGGLLLTEELSYYGLKRIAQFLGVGIAAIAMDEDGALPDAFEQACGNQNPKALYLTPTLHNPTTLIMSKERRQALVAIARHHGVAIIEDDVYGMLPTDAPPPIAAMATDVTWYATGPAKSVAPGLRIGYLVAPSEEAARRACDKFNVTSTWFVSPLSAMLSEQWIRSGAALRILDAVRAEAIARQDLARRILRHARFATKPEALHIWLALPDCWPQQFFIEAAAANGVVLRPGHMFAEDPAQAPNALRIVLGSPQTRSELERALLILAELLARSGTGHS